MAGKGKLEGLKVNAKAIGGAAIGAARDAGAKAAGAAQDASMKAANAARDAGTMVASAAQDAGAIAAGAARDAGGKVAGAAKGAYAAFGGDVPIAQESNLKDEAGFYLLPQPVVSEKEADEIDPLGERWEKAIAPGALVKAGNKVAGMLPQQLKDGLADIGKGISGMEYYQAAFEIVAKGFGALEEHAAKMSVSPSYVVNRINQGNQPEKVAEITEICLLRSYDVARIAGDERTRHLGLAFAEGAATGAPGFAGIPFNIALSMFLYFRAVQSIALFYGYDVKADPGEMVIAGDVLMAAFGGGEQGPNSKVAMGAVGKIMTISEAEVIKQTAAKGWGTMASHGGVPLVIAQIRALANKAAEKAVVKAGKETIEKNVFSSVFEQIGKRLTQTALKGSVPVVGGVIGAFFDTGLMDRVLTVADLFYHKRFIIEKPVRVRMLTEGVSFEEASS